MNSPVVSTVELRNPGAVGSVSLWTTDVEDAAAPVVLLAHGAGSRADSPVHTGICGAVANTGLAVAAFNFPYAEARRRSPDRTERLLDCYRDVTEVIQARFPKRRILAGGRSMGGRMASLLAAGGAPFAGVVLLNYPLVAGRGAGDSPPRTAHWPDITVPVLFVHGNRDRLFPVDLFEVHRPLLEVPTTVHVIDDADHMFAVPKRASRTPSDVYREVAAAIATWSSSLAVRT